MSDNVTELPTGEFLDGMEPDESSVPVVREPLDPSLADLYAVLVDMHRMEAEKLSIMRSIAGLVNEFGAQVPEFMATLQDSPIFGMLNGGGGLLGSLFRR
jgi:hypothetical protein